MKSDTDIRAKPATGAIARIVSSHARLMAHTGPNPFKKAMQTRRKSLNGRLSVGSDSRTALRRAHSEVEIPPLYKMISIALAAAGWASVTVASDLPARVLQIPQGLCPQTVSVMVDWAAHAPGSGVGAFAMPVDPETKVGQCDSAKQAQGGTAYGYSTTDEASAAATSACELTRSADLGQCRVFAYLVDQQ